MYRLFLPHPQLQPYIDNYWSLHSDASIHQPLQEFIFVDGKADILFNFGVPYTRMLLEGERDLITASNLDGQRSYPMAILQSGAIDIMGIRFKPGGLASFLPVPIHELSNAVVSLEDVFGAKTAILEARLYDLRRSPMEQVAAVLNLFFMRCLCVPDKHLLVQAMVGYLKQNQTASIQTISTQFGYSTRSVDRFFRQTMGFSPKMALRIIRLETALERLAADDDSSFIEIAFQLGYFDQAHFSHDFKAFTGQTPSAYRAILQQQRAEPPPNLVAFLQDAATGY